VRSRVREKDRGASLVEFALVVPLLTLFLFGIIQFGIAYDMKQSINSAAREGARTGAVPDRDVLAIKSAVANSFDPLVAATVVTKVYLNVEAGTPIPDSNKPCQGNVGQTVVVVSTVKHVLTIPFFGAPEITLKGRGEFRCERTA